MKVYLPILEEDVRKFEPKSLNQFLNIAENIYDDEQYNFDYIENSKCLVDGDFTWVDNYTVLAVKNSVIPDFVSFDFQYHQINNLYSIIEVPIEDVLDFKKSKIEYLKKSKNILNINKYVFNTNKLENLYLFKIKNMKASPVYVTEKFVDFYNTNKYRGFYFKEIY